MNRPNVRTRIFAALLGACAAASSATAEDSGASAPTPSALCSARLERLLDALAAADEAAVARELPEPLRQRRSAAALRRDYDALAARYGAVLGRGRTHVGAVGEGVVALVPLVYERGTSTAEARCGADGALVDASLSPTQSMTGAAR